MAKLFFLAVVLLISASPLLGQYPRSVRSIEKSAEEKLDRRDYDGAIADFTRVIDQVTRLDSNSSIGNFGEGTAAGIRAVDPRSARALVGRGKAYIELRKIPEALRDIELAIRVAPTESVPHFLRGTIRTASGQHADALADLDRAIKLEPRHAIYYTARALAKLSLGDGKGALADHDRAVAMEPKIAAVYSQRGDARHELKDLDGALADYNKALELDAQFATAYRGRGAVMIHREQFDNALADLNRAIELDPRSSSAYALRGTIHYYHGKLTAAEDDFRKAVALDPSRLAYIEKNKKLIDSWRNPPTRITHPQKM